MADDLYHATVIWDCQSDTAGDVDITGGGWTPGTGALELKGDAFTSASGADLDGTGDALQFDRCELFGGSASFNNTVNAYNKRFTLGCFECFFDLDAIPSSDTVIWDMGEHESTLLDEIGGVTLWIEGTTGKLLVQQNAPTFGSKVDTGLTFSTGDNHFFFQVNNNDPDDEEDFTLGLGGSTYNTSSFALYYPSNRIALGHCGKVISHAGSGHGINGKIHDIRYTHNRVRYSASGAYSTPSTPFDGAAPAALTPTDDVSAYVGPCVTQVGNDEPVPVIKTFTVSSVSGGSGNFSYQWFCRYHGPLKNGVGNSVDIDLSKLRWYNSHAIYCVITDTTSDIEASTSEATITFNHDADEYTNGVAWVPDAYVNDGDVATFTPVLYGWGGDYDPLLVDSDINVATTFTVASGTMTGSDDGAIFTSDAVVSGDFGSVLEFDYYVGYGGDFDYVVPTASGTLYQYVALPSAGDEGFWRNQIRTVETEQVCGSDEFFYAEAASWSNGWTEAVEWADGQTSIDIATEAGNVLDQLETPANRTPALMARYVVCSLDDEPWSEDWSYAMEDPVEGGYYFGAFMGYYDQSSAQGFGLTSPTFFPETDDFSHYYNIAYKGAWEGGWSAWGDGDEGRPKYSSPQDTGYVLTLNERERMTYDDAWYLGYDAIWNELP